MSLLVEPLRSEPRERFDGQNWGPYVEIDDDPDLEYVELANLGDVPVDLTGWALSGGVAFTLPAWTSVEAGGFVVIAADPTALEAWGIPSVGPFDGSLANSGERVALTDASGELVDEVEFATAPPWPVLPAAAGASLERLVLADDRTGPDNWRSSTTPLPEPWIGTGTPGAPNSVATDAVPPLVSEVAHAPAVPAPGESITITALVAFDGPIDAVTVELAPEGAAAWAEPMWDDGAHEDGAAGDGRYGAVIATGSAGEVVHYRVRVEANEAVTVWPYDDEPSPTRAYSVSAGAAARARWRLSLREADVALLYSAALASPRRDQEVDATLVVDGVVYPHVRASLGGRHMRAYEPYAWHIGFNPDATLGDATSVHTSPNRAEDQHAIYDAFAAVLTPALEGELVDLEVVTDLVDRGVLPHVVYSPPNGRWLDEHGFGDGTEVYKARSVESASPRRNSDLYWFGDLGDERADNGLQTDANLWGAYHKGPDALSPPDALRELLTAVNDRPEPELLDWLARRVDVEQWFTSIALHVMLRLDDFAGHNFYLLLPEGGRWQVLNYDFDAYGRFPPLPALYATGLSPDESPDWQRNKLHERIATSPTLTRVYLLAVRRLLDTHPPEALLPAELVGPAAEARDSLAAELAVADLPARDATPSAEPCGGDAGEVAVTVSAAFDVWATLDGADPRLSTSRFAVEGPITVPAEATLTLAAAERGRPLTEGRWTDTTRCAFDP